MTLDVYVETTKRRTFACAVDWPGWCRSGKTEANALAALVAYGPRYKAALGRHADRLEPPADASALKVVDSRPGTPTTEFGAPGVVTDLDRREVSDTELARLISMLEAAWSAFDRAAAEAAGRPLAPAGPRGGGRRIDQMQAHVHEADRAYIGGLGAKAPPSGDGWPATQAAFVAALHAKVRGELPEKGPRGGERWPARYAIRRSAWHALDHAWEIEDRSERGQS
jgi:hypothetical protein